MGNELDFFQLNELVMNMGAVNSPAELQGMLCGKLCSANTVSEDGWIDIALDFMDLQHLRLNAQQTLQLRELYTNTVRLLEDINFGFKPMLPSDDSAIARRTEELGYWCQGFLHGIGTSGIKGDTELGPEAADALRDLAQISQVYVEEDDDVAENEVYWLELVEYVKVAVLTLYTELANNTTHNTANDSKRVH